ncbi:MAG: Mth938-like domain-containing protein [Burkholderiales bacterium]|nr:Mth938-like domain-containing protein [Burkholderiales bacterium]
MKFHLQSPTANVVTGTGPGWVRVGATEYRSNLILLPDAVIEGFAPEGFAALNESDFAALLTHAPEMVLLGTGDRQRFPHPHLLQALSAAQVGVEVMDTRAACRTFNILIAEDRRVAAALIVARKASD